ncbi:MAG: LCP family protein [Candidatus Sericytochromatia bacterium]|nr:LCP family protein [Candidatus Sericytochromatia bacterium]
MGRTFEALDTAGVILAAWCTGALWGLVAGRASTGSRDLAVKPRQAKERILLVAVVDDLRPPGTRELRGHADALLLVRRRPEGGIHVLAVPRDTWLEPHETKVNGLLWRMGGGDSRRLLSRLWHLEIDAHLVLTLAAVARIVDGLGGLNVNVERPMQGEDRTAGWKFALAPGRHRLDGPLATAWFRHRGNGSDLARVDRLAHVGPGLLRRLPPPHVLASWAALLTRDMLCDEPPSEWPVWFEAARGPVRWDSLPGKPEKLGKRWIWRGDDQARKILTSGWKGPPSPDRNW